jgi:predicted histidine transporter YuiF (NhaC family)
MGKWKNYLCSPELWIGRVLIFVLGIVISKDIIPPKFIVSKWIAFGCAISIIILLILKHLWFDKTSMNEKTWYVNLGKRIPLFYGLSFSIIFLIIVNGEKIKDYISENLYSFLIQWWIQTLCSIVLIVICFLFRYLSQCNKKRKEKKSHYKKLEKDNRELLETVDNLSKEKDEINKQYEQLKIQNTNILEERRLLEDERCKHEECEKHKIIECLIKYKKSLECQTVE